MRDSDLTDTLKAAQQAQTIDPLVKIVLSKTGEDDVIYTKTRILDINHTEEPFSQRCELVLDNSDGTLTALDFKGWKGVISYGAVTPVDEEYSDCAPLWVISQTFESSPGKLDCTLSLIGIPNLLLEDKASKNYIPDEDDTKSVKTLVNEILGASIGCYSHCKSYGVSWDLPYDPLLDTYKPKDGFRIFLNQPRLNVVKKLLDCTQAVMRAEADGSVHIFAPVSETPVYTYELEE